MRIASSNITMASKQTYLEVNEQRERLKIWVGQQRPNFEGKQDSALPGPENQPDVLELSDGVKPVQPTADKLTDTKFSFDLDSNGQAEQLSFVQPGSGFLALDLNNDGIINNGSELFGPNSGDGFGELAQYDQDGNQWIDENDAIYNKLRIWSKDEQGQDQLIALGQQGIGAIYLGHITTSFDLKQPDNQLQGQIKSSGVYLNENGSAGVIQEIDLVI